MYVNPNPMVDRNTFIQWVVDHMKFVPYSSDWNKQGDYANRGTRGLIWKKVPNPETTMNSTAQLRMPVGMATVLNPSQVRFTLNGVEMTDAGLIYILHKHTAPDDDFNNLVDSIIEANAKGERYPKYIGLLGDKNLTRDENMKLAIGYKGATNTIDPDNEIVIYERGSSLNGW